MEKNKQSEFKWYKRELIKGQKVGKWELARPVYGFGENATTEMQIDGSGYFITDSDNGLQYYVDMK